MRRLLAAAAMAALPVLAGAAPHGLTAQDLVSLARISEPAISPDGRRLVYTLRETDLAADRGRNDLWMLDLDGDGPARRLTSHEENDGAADWAADGSGVFFLAARSGSPQVWFLPVGGGEATQVTRLPLDVAGFRVSPRGGRLVVALEVFADCRDLDCTRKRLEEKRSAKARGQAYDGLFVRHWDAWEDGRISQLFSIPLDGERRPRGVPVPLTASLDADIPSKPNGGRADYAFSPDGSQLVFSARVRGKLEPVSTNFDVWRVPADGSGAPVNLTSENPAWDAQPAFSPDGRLLAHLAMDRPGFEADRFRLVVRDAASGAIRFTTREWDRSIAAFRFAPDGREILATADDLGQRPLFAIDVGSLERRKLTGPGNIADFDAGGSRIVFALQSLTAPADLYLIEGRAPARPLTQVNAERLAEVRFGEFEQFAFDGANGDTVHGYVMKPWNASARRGQIPGRLPDPRRPAGQLRQRLELPLESAGVCRRRLRRRVHRFPRLDRLRPDVHRFDQRRLGRQAARGPAEGPGRGREKVPLARPRPRCALGALLRRLHDELDRGQLAGRLQVHRQPRRRLRHARHGLLDRRTVVHRLGKRRPVLRECRKATSASTRCTT